MSTIFAQPGRPTHPDSHPDVAARQRRDRLARATVDDMESALAFLSMIDPEAFEIAFTAAPPRADEFAADAAIAGGVGTQWDVRTVGDAWTAEDEEPFPVCSECGAPVGIFLEHGLRWQHFRGDAAAQEIYDPGHPAQVGWLLPGEDPEDPEDPGDL